MCPLDLRGEGGGGFSAASADAPMMEPRHPCIIIPQIEKKSTLLETESTIDWKSIHASKSLHVHKLCQSIEDMFSVNQANQQMSKRLRPHSPPDM